MLYRWTTQLLLLLSSVDTAAVMLCTFSCWLVLFRNCISSACFFSSTCRCSCALFSVCSHFAFSSFTWRSSSTFSASSSSIWCTRHLTRSIFGTCLTFYLHSGFWLNRSSDQIQGRENHRFSKCLRCYFFQPVTTTPHHNLFTALFLGPPGWAGARRELLEFMMQGDINRDRHTDHPAGRQQYVSKHWRQPVNQQPVNFPTS